jgi:hypothetical protein|tara:strand:- start:157 stop:738 length:582 start_codon:yes stop_codon:yes gene_type:complete
MANLQINNINTLEDQGKVLAEQWEVISKAENKRFNASTKTDGFDTKLGRLMVELKAEGGERIASQRLRDCHLHLIAKQRRAEALWFVENEDAARKFIAESKKGYTSLSALQKAFTKSNKPKAEDTEDTNSEADVKSDVGPTEEPTVIVTKELVFDKLVAVCKANNIDLLDIAEMLMEVDTVSEAEATEEKVAA